MSDGREEDGRREEISAAERFIDEACAGIPDRRTRERTKEELRSHIEERAEEYMLCGDTPAEAERKAIAGMGSPERLHREFAEVDSLFPLRKLKNALWLFYAGLILVSFQLDIWYIARIEEIVGTVLLFFACFLLRGGNRPLCGAWICSLVLIFVRAAAALLSVLPFDGLYEHAAWVVLLCSQIANAVRMFLFGYGIAAFAEGKISRQAKQIGWLYLAAQCAVGFLLATGAIAEIFAEIFFFPVFALFIVLIVLILRRIRHVASDMWMNDRAVEYKKMPAAGKAAVALSLVFAFALAPSVSAYVTNAVPEGSPYTAADVSDADMGRVKAFQTELAENFPADYDAPRDMLESAFADVAASDWLRLADIAAAADNTAGGTSETEIFYRFGSEYGIRTLSVQTVLYRESDPAAAGVIYYYSYIEPPTDTRAVQMSFVAQNASLRGNEGKFVHLYTEEGQTMQMPSTYERGDVSRAFSEYKAVRGREGQRGYALLEFSLYGGGGYIAYTDLQSSFYRSPYVYPWPSADGAPADGWVRGLTENNYFLL